MRCTRGAARHTRPLFPSLPPIPPSPTPSHFAHSIPFRPLERSSPPTPSLPPARPEAAQSTAQRCAERTAAPPHTAGRRACARVYLRTTGAARHAAGEGGDDDFAPRRDTRPLTDDSHLSLCRLCAPPPPAAPSLAAPSRFPHAPTALRSCRDWPHVVPAWRLPPVAPPVAPHPQPTPPTPPHLTPSHPISPHPTPSHPISPHPIPSHRWGVGPPRRSGPWARALVAAILHRHVCCARRLPAREHGGGSGALRTSLRGRGRGRACGRACQSGAARWGRRRLTLIEQPRPC